MAVRRRLVFRHVGVGLPRVGLGRGHALPRAFGHWLFIIRAFFAVGLFSYRAGNPGLPFRLMKFSQMGVFTLCIIADHVVVFYDLQGDGRLYIVTGLSYPVLYVALLGYGLTSNYVYVPGPARWLLGFVLRGIKVRTITNSLYAYALLGYDYEVGDYLDLAWILGFVLICRAAMRQRALSSGDTVAANDLASSRELRFDRMMPPLTLLVTATIPLGHEAGDNLLQRLTSRLSSCLRERDTIARFGGDDFVILLSDIADDGDIKNLGMI